MGLATTYIQEYFATQAQRPLPEAAQVEEDAGAP